MKKPNAAYFHLILAGFAFGASSVRLYYHDMWAFAGFGLASGAMILVHLHARYISMLLQANHIMGNSLKNLMHDLREAGFEITETEVDAGDAAEHMTAKLVRKDVH